MKRASTLLGFPGAFRLKQQCPRFPRAAPKAGALTKLEHVLAEPSGEMMV
jgi:hypothetical protein